MYIHAKLKNRGPFRFGGPVQWHHLHPLSAGPDMEDAKWSYSDGQQPPPLSMNLAVEKRPRSDYGMLDFSNFSLFGFLLSFLRLFDIYKLGFLGILGFSHSFFSEIALHFLDFEKMVLILIFAFVSLVMTLNPKRFEISGNFSHCFWQFIVRICIICCHCVVN